jgi:flavorubredoxin
MNAVAEGIATVGVPLDIFDVSRNHVSYILPSLWTKSGVLIGAPTYEVSLFPTMAEVLNMAVHKRIRNKKAAYFGSYGWSGGALRSVKKIVEPLKWEVVDSFEFIGSPTKEDIATAKEFGQKFARLVKS